MDILGSPLLIVRTVSVDLKQHWKRMCSCRTHGSFATDPAEVSLTGLGYALAKALV